MSSWGRLNYKKLLKGIKSLSSTNIPTATDVLTRVQNGTMFSIGLYDDALAAGDSIDVSISTSGTNYTHMTYTLVTSSEGEGALYEGSSVADGTPITLYNHKRTSLRTYSGTVVSAPTVNSVGTLLHQTLLPGGSVTGGGGSSQAFADEWVLKQNENYLLRVFNRGLQPITATTIILVYEAEFIEDTNFLM